MLETAGDSTPHLDKSSPQTLLTNHLKISGEIPVDEKVMSTRFGWVFQSPDPQTLVSTIIELSKLHSHLFERFKQAQFWIGSSIDASATFIRYSPTKEAKRRFETLAKWMDQVNTQNFDGVVLTPTLIEHLAKAENFDGALSTLDHLREKTLVGEFNWEHVLQRELEFKRFVSVKNHLNAQSTTDKLYDQFHELKELPQQTVSTYKLSDREQLEVRRTAVEATLFLQFLLHFRRKTNRPIVVVGNYRYGRHWVVEPIEEYLENKFDVRYYRVPSHHSMRLTVPYYLERQVISGFPPEFVKELSEEMPHVIIVDVCSPSRTDGVSKFSRALRDYINWFMIFNDIRAEGVESVYEQSGSIPQGHLKTLKKWYQSVQVRRQLQEWVIPGQTYSVAHWTPELQTTVLMGDSKLPSKKPNPSDSNPCVVVANPAIYRTTGENLPEVLRKTQPYYFNDPEKHVSEEITLGYSNYGIETRVSGPTTDQFIAAVQRQLRKEIRILVEAGGVRLRQK